MSYADYRRLIDQGRKAGLRMSDLCNALTPCQGGRDGEAARTEGGNGMASSYGRNGEHVYQPLHSRPRS